MYKSPPPPVITVLGFFVTGLFCFGLACVLLLLRPDSLTGDPVRGAVLALTHLITLGWIGSVLFASAYLVGPMLAGSGLWSNWLAAAHLGLHLSGLALMLGGLFRLRYDIAGIGALLLFLGLTLMVVNLVVTGSRRSLWSPANIAFQMAMFWLTVTGVLALLMLRGRLAGPVLGSPETLIALHAHIALFGFLAQGILAVSLRLVPLSVDVSAHPKGLDRLAWIACGALNAGLMLMAPAALVKAPFLVIASGSAIALGVVLFAVDLLTILWLHRQRVSWGAITHATGVALLAAIVVIALWRLPDFAANSLEQTREWMRVYISLALLGPFSFCIIGTAERGIPRLVWNLRYAPWRGHGNIPQPETLGREAAAAPAYFTLVLAWIYLALGQVSANPHALRIGAILLLLGFGWFLFSLLPALVRLVLGVTPDDLNLPSTPESADSGDRKLS